MFIIILYSYRLVFMLGVWDGMPFSAMDFCLVCWHASIRVPSRLNNNLLLLLYRLLYWKIWEFKTTTTTTNITI